MRILITGSNSLLGKAASEHFSEHELRFAETLEGDLGDLVRDLDAILHLAAFGQDAGGDAREEQDALMRATHDTYRLCEAAAAAGVERIVVAGSLKIFAAYPDEYLIDEMWRPRPRPQVGDLAPYLCEKVVREFVRVGGLNGVCLRFCPIGDDPEHHTRLADALEAMNKALAVPLGAPGYRWHIIHVASSPRFLMRDARMKLGFDRSQKSGCRNQRPEVGGQESEVRGKLPDLPDREIRKVCIFGAGGPVGASIAPLLCEHYTVRFTDVLPVDELVSRPRGPTWPGWDAPPAPPHEWTLCDITDYGQVLQAVSGCDAVINLTVNRSDPESAFRINAIGTYNVMKAALAHRPMRIIQTGPITRVNGYEGDYRYEYGITADAPLRPGTHLYAHTKFLGHQIADAFAREAGLDVFTFLVSRLRPHDAFDHRDDNVMISFSTAWEDLGPAFLKGLQAPRMPHPNEIFHICADLPFGKYDPEKAERLLGWKAKHTFERFYRRSVLDEKNRRGSASGALR